GHTEDEQPDSEDEHGGTDPIAPGVAEEGLGSAQVERQESDGRAGQRQRQEREVLVADPRADEGVPAGGDDDPFGDATVESVDEVRGDDGAGPDYGEGEHMGDSLSREHRDGRTEQQSQDELADQSSDGSQRVEVIAHPDRRIAPSEHQESDG